MSFVYADLDRRQEGKAYGPVRPVKRILLDGEEALTPERSRLMPDHEAVIMRPDLFEVVDEPELGQDPEIARARAARTRKRMNDLVRTRGLGGRTRTRTRAATPSRSAPGHRPLDLPDRALRLPE
jgi:hypothetical protein